MGTTTPFDPMAWALVEVEARKAENKSISGWPDEVAAIARARDHRRRQTGLSKAQVEFHLAAARRVIEQQKDAA